MTHVLSPSQIESLLGDLCAELGFCLPSPESKRYLLANPSSDIDEFTDVFMFECEITPERHPEERALIREMVARHFSQSS